MGSDPTRRAFLRDTSVTAAALTTLASARPTEATAADSPKLIPYVCVTCGSQFTESSRPPEHCPVCEDERQYVNPDGQEWKSLDQIRATHKNTITQEETHLYSINTVPKFSIGQRAFLIQTPRGNILWDCVSLIDDATIARIKELGGVAEIAISHPHYYTTMVEWSRASATPQSTSTRRNAPGDASRPLCQVLERRDPRASRRVTQSGPNRRAFRRLSGASLARRGRRARSVDGGRPTADLHGSEAGQLHV